MSPAALGTDASELRLPDPREQVGDDCLHPGPAPITASHPRIAALEAPEASLHEARAACGQDRATRGGARRRVHATGRVVEIRVAAATERPSCEALLLVRDPRDARRRTTAVRLVWQGQRTVPGVRAGTELSCSGLLCSAGDQPTIFNPRFEIISRKASR